MANSDAGEVEDALIRLAVLIEDIPVDVADDNDCAVGNLTGEDVFGNAPGAVFDDTAFHENDVRTQGIEFGKN